MSPSLFIVPGIWEGPEAFEPLRSSLAAQGHERVHISSLRSTGTSSSVDGKCISMEDDMQAIAEDLSRYVQQEAPRQVVVLLHSAGGFLGSQAIKDLTVASQSRLGKQGGVSRIVFLTAAIAPEGHEHSPKPFMEFSDDQTRHTCREPARLLFNDTDASTAEHWISKLQIQPGKGWDGTISYCGWRDVPSTYIVCGEDQVIPVQMQEMCAKMAQSEVKRIHGAGHMAQITKTEEVAKIVADVLL